MRHLRRSLAALFGNRRRGRLRKVVATRLSMVWASVVWFVRRCVRHLARSLPYALIAVAMMLMPVAAVWGYRYVTVAPHFGVKEVLVDGNRRLSAQYLLESAGLDRSPNVLALDLESIEARLLEDPWIRAARVERRLPNRVILTIREHEPAALIALGALYLVDRRGKVFKRVEPGEHFDYPVLTGLSRGDLGPEAEPERTGASHRLVRGGLRLLDVWAASPLSEARRVSEVHMDPLFGYALVLGDGPQNEQGAIVRLGRGAIREKLDRLEAILADAARRGRRLGEVRLNDERDPSRVAVRFRPAVPGAEQKSSGAGAADGETAPVERL